ERPATPFVADFIGQTNLLACTVEGVEAERVVLRRGDTRLLAAPDGRSLAAGASVQVSLRPERIALGLDQPALDNALAGAVSRRVYLGALTHFHVQAGADVALVVATSDRRLADRVERDSRVWVGWNAGDERLV